MIFGDEDKKRRTRKGKTEWEAIKRTYRNKCVICGRTDKQVGGLMQAHIKAHSRGGSQVFPLCAVCHKKYDQGSLTATQLKKIGLTPAQYKKLRPSKKKEEEEVGFPASLRL